MSILTEVRTFLGGVFEPPFESGGQKLLVGVSGGPDSLCLLHVLKELYPPNCLVAVHLNHQLRKSAAAEADIVAAIAADWGVTVVIGTSDVNALSQEQGLTIEEAGRIARYQLFAQVAAQRGILHAAVAHHADDQVETTLMHLLRGAGLAGLQGMLPLTPMPTAPGITLLRPLLATGRAEIMAYCVKHHLPYVEDSSNQDVDFFRNRIRHELIPELLRYSPQIKSHLLQLAAASAGDHAFIDAAANIALEALIQEEGDGWLSFEWEKWFVLPLSMKRAVLRKLVVRLLPSARDIGFKTVEQARAVLDKGKTGTKSVLPGNVRILVEARRILIAINAAALADSADVPQLKNGKPVELPVPGSVDLDDQWVMEAELIEAGDLSEIFSNPNPWVAYIAYHQEKFVVRGRRQGERVQPLGMAGRTISLKKLMINHKIPSHTRSRWPLLVDQAAGERLVWLPGYQIDERYKVTAESQRLVRVFCRRRENSSQPTVEADLRQ